MDERIKEKLINRAKTNPYVNFLGIDFTVIEEGLEIMPNQLDY